MRRDNHPGGFLPLPWVSAAISTLALLSVLFAPSPAAAGAASPGEARAHLVEALSGDPAALRRVLPGESKVFVDLSTPRPARGYFGASQVITLVRELLATHGQPDVDDPGEGTDQREMTIGVRLRPRRDGPALTLRFVLRHGKAGWTVREVREVREGA